MALLNRFRKDGSTLTPLKGNRPTAALTRGDVIGVNNTFSRGQYTEYILATKTAAELKRAQDLTGNP
jgi:hypothetical protein